MGNTVTLGDLGYNVQYLLGSAEVSSVLLYEKSPPLYIS